MANTLELDLATEWGVPRDALKKMRREKLQVDRDYLLGRGGAIEITPAGAKKMRAELGLPHPVETLHPPPGRPALAWQGNDLVARAHHGDPEAKRALKRHHVLTVVKAAANKIIVVCTTEGGEPATLHVKDNQHFTAGMKVQTCVHVQGSHYDYEGRLPRRRGKF